MVCFATSVELVVAPTAEYQADEGHVFATRPSARDIVTAAALEKVHALAADEPIIAESSEHPIVSRPAEKNVVALARIEDIASRSAKDVIAAPPTRYASIAVAPGSQADGVASRSAISSRIVVVPSENPICTGARADPILSRTGPDHVCAATAPDDVAFRRTDDHVVAWGSRRS
jgi:hypothetical protein